MCGKGSKTTTTVNTPPPEVIAQYKQVMARANQVAQTPYEAYTGQRTAGLTPEQLQATQYLGNAATSAQNPMYWTPDSIQQYMSPYTQSVINATMANQNVQDQLQQQQIITNAIKQGNAFGGDRMGLAQAELARNQSLANNQTIAGLWNQNWNQANDQFNKQQQYGLQSNESAAKLATQYLGAGTLAQQTNQNDLNAQYEAYQNRIAYPYQQVGWLGNLSMGIGSNSGGTSTATTSGGSGLGQLFGGGMALASMFMSDEKAKENIREIGETHDGQKIYAYNYKGDPRTQIGLIAQEVEQHHPEAVGTDPSGLKMVDYDKATEDSVGRFATGGVPGLAGARALGLIPDMQFGRGAGGMNGIPTSKAPEMDSGPSPQQLGQQAGRLGQQIRDRVNAAGLGADGPRDIRPMAQSTQDAVSGASRGLGLAPTVDAPDASLQPDFLNGFGGVYATGGVVGTSSTMPTAHVEEDKEDGGLGNLGALAKFVPMMFASGGGIGGGFGDGAGWGSSNGGGGGGFGAAGWGANAGAANQAQAPGGMAGGGWGRGFSGIGGMGYGNTPMPPTTTLNPSGPYAPDRNDSPYPVQQTPFGGPSIHNIFAGIAARNPMIGGMAPMAQQIGQTMGGMSMPNLSAQNARALSPFTSFFSSMLSGLAAGGQQRAQPQMRMFASGGAVDLEAPSTPMDAMDGGLGSLPAVIEVPREMLARRPEEPTLVMERAPLPEARPREVEVAALPAPRDETRRPAEPASRAQLPAHTRAFLDTIAGPESGGRYNVRFDGSPTGATFDDFSRHPNVPVRIPDGQGFTAPGRNSTAAGRYQITNETWQSLPPEIRDAGFSPENQDRAAVWLASRRYADATGRNLSADLEANGMTPEIVRALAPTWESLGRQPPERAVAAYAAAMGRPNPGPAAAPASPPAYPAIVRGPTRPLEPENSGTERSRGRTQLPRFGEQFLENMGIRLSDNTRQAMLAAGLAMMASNNRNPLGAIGEGGLRGVQEWNAREEADRARADTASQVSERTSHAEQRVAETELKRRQLAQQENFDRVLLGILGPGIPGVTAPAAPAAGAPAAPTGGAAPVAAPSVLAPPSTPSTAPAPGAPAGGAPAPAPAAPAAPPPGMPPALATPQVMTGLTQVPNIDPQWDPRRLSAVAMAAAATPGREKVAEWANNQLERITRNGMVRTLDGQMVPLPGYSGVQAAQAGEKRGAERMAENDTGPRTDEATGATFVPSSARGPAPAPAAAPPQPSSAPPAGAEPAPATPAPAPAGGAPAPAPAPAAARIERARIVPGTSRVETAIPAVPAGTAGGYPRMSTQPGEYVGTLGPAEQERRKNNVTVEDEVMRAGREANKFESDLRQMGQAFKLFTSGALNDRLQGAAAIITRAGYPDIAQRMLRGEEVNGPPDANGRPGPRVNAALAATQWVDKLGIGLSLDSLKQANSRFTQAEFMTMQQRGMPNANMEPQAAHALIANMLGNARMNAQFASDWERAQREGWANINAFANEWKKANPPQTFVEAARRDLGTFRGMPLPPTSEWVPGATYVVPERLTPRQAEVLGSHGIRAGQTFRYGGGDVLERVDPREAFSAHMRQ